MDLRIVRIVTIGALLVGVVFSMQGAGQKAPPPREFTLVNTEVNGIVIWLPSVIVVHPGERVTLKLINKVEAVHGFSIDAYDIHVIPYWEVGRLVPAGGVKEVTFIAKRRLVSRFYCQLHAGHIGGQIVVIE